MWYVVCCPLDHQPRYLLFALFVFAFAATAIFCKRKMPRKGKKSKRADITEREEEKAQGRQSGLKITDGRSHT